MAAEVAINRLTGGGPTYTRVDVGSAGGSLRPSLSDSPNPGNSDPILIPNPGAKVYSYWVTLQLETLTSPTNTVDNIRFYTEGFNKWPGVDTYVALASDYVQATGTPGVNGTPLRTLDHTELLFEAVPIWNFTEAEPLVVPGSTSTTEEFGNLIVMQLVASAQAASGTLEFAPFTIIWDEHV